MSGVRDSSPVIDHLAFPVVLGFVAGFMDIFGFLSWHGLLAAHVTGNLIFLAVNLALGQYALVMKLLALPIFAAFVAISAWYLHSAIASGGQPLMGAIVHQAQLIGLCLLAGLALPSATGPDSVGSVVPGSIALFAMALQNTTMRLILNNMPPTTVMTGNITYVVSEVVQWSLRRGTGLARAVGPPLARRGMLIACTLAGFTAGAIVGGFAQVHVGYFGLLIPIAALLGLVPVARAGAHSEA